MGEDKNPTHTAREWGTRHVHDAPHHKDNPNESGKEQKPMNKLMELIRGWLNHLGDAQNSNRVVAIFTIVIAITGIIYAVFAGKQLGVMRDTFNAANKPSVGVNHVGVWHIGRDKEGKITRSEMKTVDTTALSVAVEIKNFGQVVAEDYTSTWRGFVDGKEVPRPTESTPPGNIFPGQVRYLIGGVGQPDYTGIADGTKTFEIQVTIHYKGPNQTYAYCQKERYMTDVNAFGVIGSCPVT